MPLIGLLSDSHGRASTTRQAVEALLGEGVDVLLHLGDVGSVEVLDAVATAASDGRSVERHVVFGNTDWDLEGLAEYAEDVDVHVAHPVGRLTWGDKAPTETGPGDGPGAGPGDGVGVLVYCHGHQEEPLRQALAERVAYLCHGHTHRAEDRREGSTRIVNPGALFRAQTYTVAVLDTETDTVRHLELAVP